MELNITKEDYLLMLGRIAIFKKCIHDLAEIEIKYEYDCDAKRIADRTLKELQDLEKNPPRVHVDCNECNGVSVNFRGIGMDVHYRICSKVDTEGHLTMDEVRVLVRKKMQDNSPKSGRFA